MLNKLGLSCAKLRASCDVPGFDLVWYMWFGWFGIVGLAL